MARVTVYGSPPSPFVEKVRRGLALKKVDYELVPPKSPFDLRRWNPQTGKMPVVEIDGERTYDSTFILRRLDALFPEPPLVSTDPATLGPTPEANRLLGERPPLGDWMGRVDETTR